MNQPGELEREEGRAAMRAYYKFLEEDGGAFHGGEGSWPLPGTGEWKTVEGMLVPCVNGLHVCLRGQLVEWLGPAVFVCEVDGETIDAGSKTVVRKARLVSRFDTWNDRTARLFAADCAERALNCIEKKEVAVDPRSRAAVEAARGFANGNVSKKKLIVAGDAANAAAWDADRAADRYAARAAAWAAAEVAAWAAARDAAWAAAWAAAEVAAWAANRAAAWAAERKWQTDRLFQYLDGKRGSA